ncbi:SDR family NAD(P)-dependent oxidoreductase [Pararhizobium haloflavum]|uniref:SDR family NAD(P)-dependent oxidoreductase n=1 Tax=Pararhizobium haloflavum TaxID=2037914 RepID=UPI000C1884C3|nr:SDR family oxidoreductase [Pararhizobium haloflavum]
MRVSVVIGACGGLGRVIVDRLCARGDRVLLLDHPDNTDVAAGLIGALADADARFVPCDLACATSIETAFESVGEEKRLDVLVNAAGIIRRGAFVELSARDLDAVFAVNVLGAFRALQAGARQMIASGGGRIVNIASVHGLRTSPGRSAYAASKGAILSLTRAMAVELGSHNILVNAVAPGPVTAGMQEGEASAARGLWTRGTLGGRVARADEIADAVMFLVSDANGFMNGETLTIDGGASAAIAAPAI